MNVIVSGMVLSKHHFTTCQCCELDKRNPSTWGCCQSKQEWWMRSPCKGRQCAKQRSAGPGQAFFFLFGGLRSKFVAGQTSSAIFFMLLTVCAVWELGPNPTFKVVMFRHNGDFTCFKVTAHVIGGSVKCGHSTNSGVTRRGIAWHSCSSLGGHIWDVSYCWCKKEQALV